MKRAIKASTQFSNIDSLRHLLRMHNIDTRKHKYQLEAVRYDRYELGPIYTYLFSTYGDWMAYISMTLHSNMTPNMLDEFIEDYWGPDLEDLDLELLDGVEAMKNFASRLWWGDGDDAIIRLTNLDTGEILYESDDADTWDDQEEL